MIPPVSNNVITIFSTSSCWWFPYIETYYGKTLLETAVENGHSDIVHYLIMEKGCVPTCHEGRSPDVLMLACEHGQLDLVEKLIEDHHWDITRSYCK